MTPFTRFTQARAAGFAAALSVLMLGSAAPAQMNVKMAGG